jgi:endonuclease/exonuclease/phosphatase family metal-dependent hydrolase
MTRLRLVSYNIKSCLQGGVEGIAAALADLEPDVVGLQEVDQGTVRAKGVDQAAALADALGLGYAAFGAATAWSGGGRYGVGVLSRYPLESVGTWPLHVPVAESVAESLREPRALLGATVRLPKGGALRVLVTHFGLGPEQRLIQGRELAAAAFQASAFGPVVVLGDLNAPPDGVELEPVLGVLRDAHAAVPAERRGTYPAGSFAPGALITDYVLVSTDLPSSGARIVPDLSGASDHNLCVVDVVAS